MADQYKKKVSYLFASSHANYGKIDFFKLKKY